MYSQQQYDAWSLELANHFVERYQYKIVSLAGNQKEIWLVNAENQISPIIMIAAMPIQNFDMTLIHKNRESLATVFGVKTHGLNISVVEDRSHTSEINVVVGPGLKTPSGLWEGFPDIQTVLQPSTDPERSLGRAISGLQKNIRIRQNIKPRPVPATYSFMILIGIVFVIAQFLLSNDYNINAVAVLLGGFYKRFIVDAFEYWRLLTAGFVHLEFWHFLMNALALYNLGRIMEPILGWKKFTGVLLLGIVYGNVFAFITDTGMLGVGISGGLYALLGAYLVLLFETKAIRRPGVLNQIASLLLINLLISLMPGISFAGHLGGLQIGVLLGLAFSKREDWKSLRTGVMVIIAVSAAAFVVVMIQQSQTLPNAAFESLFLNTLESLHLNDYAQHLRGLLN